MGKGGGKQVLKSEPWAEARPFLKSLMGDAQDLYNQGGFSADPYGGPRVAGQSGATQNAYDAIMRRGAGSPMIGGAVNTLQGLMENGGVPGGMTDGSRMLGRIAGGSDVLRQMSRGDPRLERMARGRQIYRDLDKVKDNALGSAIPAAVSMFSGSGMTDSSTAMDAVGRAATEAVAPIDYGAWQAAQDRALAATGQDNATRLAAQGQNVQQRLGAQGQNFGQRLGAMGLQQGGQLSAAGMMPQMQAASYLPAQMLAQAGAGQDAYRQSQIQAAMQKYYEGQGQRAGNLQNYAGIVGPMGGMGGVQQQGGGGIGTGAKVGAAGLGGLGTFGALAAVPGIGLPLAGVGGGLAALMGLL